MGCGAASTAAAALVLCQAQAEKYWIAPQTTAYRFLLAQIRGGLPSGAEEVHVIRQGHEDGLVPEYLIESFRRPSSERD